MTRPYEGICVLDLSDRLSGAYAARLFGDYGATVLLVEPPSGHPLRHEPPFLNDEPGPDRSALHAYVNWNKRSVVAGRIPGQADREEIAALVASADVVVTTRSPVPTEQLEVLGQLASDAVHLSITPHGLAGSLASTRGNNLTASARTGWSYINRYEGEPPLQMPARQSGYVAGVTGFLTAAAALLRRDQAGEPERVDVSEVEAFALTVHPWAIAAVYQNLGWSNGPAGGKTRGEPGPLWQTRDGQINFGLGDWHNWPRAMELLNLPELGERRDLTPDVGRHSQDLSAVAAGAAREVAAMDRWPLFHALAELRCISGVLQDTADIVADPQLTARGFVVATEIEGRPMRAAGAPAHTSPARWELRTPAPRLASSRLPEVVETERARPSRAVRGRPGCSPSPDGPLAGTRVLSFGQAWSGTFGTELLALLGADVVQIETRTRHDVWRRTRDRVPSGLRDAGRRQHARNTQGLYNSVNLNKRAITLDLSQPRGLQIFWQLLPRFDVLADNFRPTVLPRWGMTLETLNQSRPGIIYASISAYGSDGPRATYPGNGATTEPMSGLSSIHGYEGDPGMNTGGLYPDPVAAYFFAASVVTALHERNRTGRPQRVDLSMMEAMGVVIGDAILEYDATGRVPRPRGNRDRRISPHNHYPALNGEWLALAAESEASWRALAREMGRPELADAPRFRTMVDRKRHEDELDRLIAEWTVTQDATATERRLGSLGLTVARVAPFYELYSRPDPNFAASGFVGVVDHPEAGPTLLPGRPWRLSGAPASPLRPAPCVGEHSQEFLARELGIGDDEYALLVRAGITGTLDD